MKCTLAFLAGIAIAVSAAAADDTVDKVKIDDVKTPPSPAFVLLGIAPSAVERPTTPRAVGVSLLSSLQDSGSSALPKNFALEVAPYWLVSHPDLTRKTYTEPGFVRSLRQTFSVSIATAEQKADATTGAVAGTLGGIGVRTAYLAGKRSTIEEQITTAIENAIAPVGDQPPQPNTPPPPIISGDSQTTKLLKGLRDIEHEGRWFIEAAAGTTALFESNDSSKSKHQKSGVWLTPSYRLRRSTFNGAELKTAPKVDFVGVARWLSDHTTAEASHPFDLGARVIWNHGDFALSAEHLRRRRSKTNGQRTAAIGELKVSDDLFFTATFGKDFRTAGRGDLIAILGLHFGVGKKPLLTK